MTGTLLVNADARALPLADESVHLVVTSPPYFSLRDYGVPGQIGLERTVEAYIDSLLTVFREVKRILRDDGVCFVNLGDSYAGSGKGPSNSLQRPASSLNNRQLEAGAIPTAWVPLPSRGQRMGSVNGESGHTSGVTPPPGLKPKDLCLIPERFALAMQQDGWYVRSRIAWCKRAPMPESVTDRPTSAWEHIWLFSKSRTYFWDQEAVRTPYTEDSAARIERPWNGTVFRGTPIGMGEQHTDRWMGSERAKEMASRGSNQRNYWLLSPEPLTGLDHYAAFPTEIPRRAILAGTSERGCCPACGAPWRRVVERVVTADPSINPKAAAVQTAGLDSARLNGTAGSNHTLGWQPSCTCPPAIPQQDGPNGIVIPAVPMTPVPCTVFDPFSGAGTTLLVANRLGRRGVGVELNPEYARMARRRIVQDAPLFNGMLA